MLVLCLSGNFAVRAGRTSTDSLTYVASFTTHQHANSHTKHKTYISSQTLCAVNVDRNPVSDRNSGLSARKPNSFYSQKSTMNFGARARIHPCATDGKNPLGRIGDSVS